MKTRLIEDNMKLVYTAVNKYFPVLKHDEDIIQTGMVGLVKAADKWDEKRGKFSTFATNCICNEIRMELRNRKKHKGVLSLDYEIADEDGHTVTMGDLYGKEDDHSIIESNYENFYHRLTERQRQIWDLSEQGYEVQEIATELSISRATAWRDMREIERLKKEWC